MKFITDTTWRTSIELARERGAFPYFDRGKYLQGDFFQRLPEDIQKGVAQIGVRNSHHNTIAPTGTISLIANNVSNGIEPVFSSQYNRTVRSPEHKLLKFSVTDYALALWQKMHDDKTLPPAWVDSHSLSPQEHLNMQAAVQTFY